MAQVCLCKVFLIYQAEITSHVLLEKLSQISAKQATQYECISKL